MLEGTTITVMVADDKEISNGDCFDEDLDIYYGQLTDNEMKPIAIPPINLSIYINGVYYVYQVTSRRAEEAKQEEQIEPPEDISSESEEGEDFTNL